MARFFRWVPKEHAETAIKLGLKSHNKSALWIFGMGQNQTYRPAGAITRNAYLLAYDMDDVATLNVQGDAALNVPGREHLDFEHSDFQGEGQHPTKIITKNNEPGAFGLGVLRQHWTRGHVKTVYATKKEVAKALGLSEREVDNAYRPGDRWPT